MCPFCQNDPIANQQCYLRIENVAASVGGGRSRWVNVRCRCCNACKIRVRGYRRFCWTWVPAMLAGPVIMIVILGGLTSNHLLPRQIANPVIGAMAIMMMPLWIVAIFAVKRARKTVLQKLHDSTILKIISRGIGMPGGGIVNNTIIHVFVNKPWWGKCMDLVMK